MLNAIIAVICTFLLIPESSRWLANKRRFDETKSALKWIATVNKKPLHFRKEMFENNEREIKICGADGSVSKEMYSLVETIT